MSTFGCTKNILNLCESGSSGPTGPTGPSGGLGNTGPTGPMGSIGTGDVYSFQINDNTNSSTTSTGTAGYKQIQLDAPASTFMNNFTYNQVGAGPFTVNAEYSGPASIDLLVKYNCTFNKVAGGTDILFIAVHKNGTIVSESIQQIEFSGMGTNPIAGSTILSVAPTDTLDVRIESSTLTTGYVCLDYEFVCQEITGLKGPTGPTGPAGTVISGNPYSFEMYDNSTNANTATISVVSSGYKLINLDTPASKNLDNFIINTTGAGPFTVDAEYTGASPIDLLVHFDCSVRNQSSSNDTCRLALHLNGTKLNDSVQVAQFRGTTVGSSQTLHISGSSIVSFTTNDTIDLRLESSSLAGPYVVEYFNVSCHEVEGNIGPTGPTGASSSQSYDAIIPDDYALPSDAIADSKVNLFIRDGTYTELSDLTLPSKIRITGESRDAIIDFNGATNGIVHSATIYSTGTVSMTNATSTITGVGTSWLTSGLASGDAIVIDPNYIFYIVSVDSDTQITTDAVLESSSITAGTSYVAFTPSRVELYNLAVTNSTEATTATITLSGGIGNIISGCTIYNCVNGYSVTNCYNTVVQRVAFRDITTMAIQTEDCAQFFYSMNTFDGIGSQGIDFNGNNTVGDISNNIFSNVNGAITFGSNDFTDLLITNNLFQNVENDAIVCGNTSGGIFRHVEINDNIFRNCGSDGIVLRLDLEFCSCSRNKFVSIGSTGIRVNGTYTRLNCSFCENRFDDVTDTAMTIAGNTPMSYMNVSDNLISACGRGIVIDAVHSVISNNIISDCVAGTRNGYGIELEANCDDCIVSGNNCTNNVQGAFITAGATDNLVAINNFRGNTTNYTDNGTTTTNTSNLT